MKREKIEDRLIREGKTSELKKKRLNEEFNPYVKKKLLNTKSTSMSSNIDKNFYKKRINKKNAGGNSRTNFFQTERNNFSNNSTENSLKKKGLNSSYSKIKSDRENKGKQKEKGNQKSKSFFCSKDQIVRLFSPYQFICENNPKKKDYHEKIQANNPNINDEMMLPLNEEKVNLQKFDFINNPDINTFSFGYVHINNFKGDENNLLKKYDETKEFIVSPRISDFQPKETKRDNLKKLFLKNNQFINRKFDFENEGVFIEKKEQEENEKCFEENNNDINSNGFKEDFQNTCFNSKKNEELIYDNQVANGKKSDLKEPGKKRDLIKLNNRAVNSAKNDEGDPSYAELHRKRAQSLSNASYLKKL
jgi:hypothetical protein